MRRDEPDLQLGPDGKVIVMVSELDEGYVLDGFSCSLQQMAGASDIALHRKVRKLLEEELGRLSGELSCLSSQVPESLSVNGAGTFEVGGPEGDNGLSGKKLVVDAYGPRVPIGGGALSGKDFFKVDRAGAIHARRIAKAIVMTGAAEEALVRLAWFPGDTSARLVSIEGEDGRLLNVSPWQSLFDLSLEGSGEGWTGNANLLDVARYGHFTNGELPWEKLRFASFARQEAA
jgi:S-adenosylmethionine synthetase